MAVRVVDLSVADIDGADAVATLTSERPCSLNPRLVRPTREQLAAWRAHPELDVLVARDGGTVAACVVAHGAHVKWALVPQGRWADLGTALCAEVWARHGDAWGVVENPDVAAEMLSVPGFFVEGDRIHWKPSI
jgi:hypothetical protein